MESLESLNIAKREKALAHWLQNTCALSPDRLLPLAGDASFRRYFRVTDAARSYIIMDAPPPRENCKPYVAVAHALRAMGLQTPDILQADLEQGFLLITDFGDKTYLKALPTADADLLYGRALDALATMQACSSVPGLVIPTFTQDWMWQEWAWYKEWFLQKLLGLTFTSEEKALDQCYQLIVELAIAQPQVFMHRDYHSANLMVLPEAVGILDFQDAFIGPLTYDLVSLLRDCYIAWPVNQVRTWALAYMQRLQQRGVLIADLQPTVFLRWFDWMGIQRHLKALMTFARKQVRDQQPAYLVHLPRTLTYLLSTTAAYPELQALHLYLKNKVVPCVQ